MQNMMSPKQVSARLGFSRPTLYRLIALGRFPPPSRLPSSQRVYWPEEDVEAWHQANRRKKYVISEAVYLKLKELSLV